MKSLTQVLLRILALYFGFKLINMINLMVYYLGVAKDVEADNGIHSLPYYISSTIIFLLFSIVLWIYNEQIAGIIVKDNDVIENCQINVTYKELLDIVLKIFGLLLILNAIEPTARQIISLQTINLSVFDISQRGYFLIALLNPVLRLVLGAYLIFRTSKGK